MRPTLRLLANLKPGTYLTPGNPTGLTGLFTHPAPRSTLLYLYSSTLDLLQTLPAQSAYRVSTEALTKHRLQIVEAIKPAGYDEWATAARKQVEEHPEVFNTPEGGVHHDEEKLVKSVHAGRAFVTVRLEEDRDADTLEWDGEKGDEERKRSVQGFGGGRPGRDAKTVEWVPEPALEARQVEDMENQLGGGLIEEVIQVAEGELKLVGVMAKAKVWEELEDKAPEGQWQYFARDQHTPPTQEPPNK